MKQFKIHSSSSDSVHTVTVKPHGKHLRVSCTCRGFRTWDHCKHQAVGIAKFRKAV